MADNFKATMANDTDLSMLLAALAGELLKLAGNVSRDKREDRARLFLVRLGEPRRRDESLDSNLGHHKVVRIRDRRNRRD
jgi:hypothetical protein